MSEKPINTSSTGNINHIAQDVLFSGDIEYTDSLIISGLLLGNIVAHHGTLDITKKGVIDGNLTLGILNNKGSVSGNIDSEKINLYSHSITQSSINTKEILIERHAKVSGKITMPIDDNEL